MVSEPDFLHTSIVGNLFLGYMMSALVTSSTSSTTIVPSILAISVGKKLTNANYPL
jgi:hypothetical protein